MGRLEGRTLFFILFVVMIPSVFAQIPLVEYVDTGFILTEGKYIKATDFVVPSPPSFTGYEPGSTVGVKLPSGEVIIVEGYGERGFWIFQAYSGFKVYKIVNGKETVLANINQGIDPGTYFIYIKYMDGKVYFSYTKPFYQGDVEPQVIFSYIVGPGLNLGIVGKNIEIEDPSAGQGNPFNPGDSTYLPQIVVYEYLPYILIGLFILLVLIVIIRR